jgi:beta-lactamase regulating signal transducer with metallopeptidase domain
MSLTGLTNSPAWTAAGWTMLHLVWVGAIVGATAALARRLLRSLGPEIRHAVALVCLMVMASSPAVIFGCVFRPAPLDVFALTSPLESSASARVVVNRDLERVIPARNGSENLTKYRAIEASKWTIEFIVPYLPAFWLTGSLSALLMLTTGLIGVHRLRRSSRIFESGEIPRRLRVLANSLGIARRVSIGICDRLAVPVLVGVIRPLILLPPAALCGWSIEQLEMVLLHELAHLRRWDNLINIMQRVVESLLFFHPVVWWLSGWLRLEREL